MKPSKLNPSDPISILGFLHDLRTANDNDGIHEGAASLIVPQSMKEPAEAPFPYRMSATKNNKIHK